MSTNENASASGMELLALLHNAFRHIARARHSGGHAHHAQRRVLSILAHRSSPGPVSQREMLEELGVRSASLSEVLAKLERHGLIQRERDEADRRNFIIRLTEAGRAESQEHGDELRGAAENIFNGFSGAEREQLAALLRKLNASLEEFHPDGSEESYGHDGHPRLRGGPRGRRGGGPFRGHPR